MNESMTLYLCEFEFFFARVALVELSNSCFYH